MENSGLLVFGFILFVIGIIVLIVRAVENNEKKSSYNEKGQNEKTNGFSGYTLSLMLDYIKIDSEDNFNEFKRLYLSCKSEYIEEHDKWVLIVSSVAFHNFRIFKFLIKKNEDILGKNFKNDYGIEQSLALCIVSGIIQEKSSYFIEKAFGMLDLLLSYKLDNINYVYSDMTVFDLLLECGDFFNDKIKELRFNALNKIIQNECFDVNSIGMMGRTPLWHVISMIGQYGNEPELEDLAIKLINDDKIDLNFELEGATVEGVAEVAKLDNILLAIRNRNKPQKFEALWNNFIAYFDRKRSNTLENNAVTYVREKDQSGEYNKVCVLSKNDRNKKLDIRKEDLYNFYLGKFNGSDILENINKERLDFIEEKKKSSSNSSYIQSLINRLEESYETDRMRDKAWMDELEKEMPILLAFIEKLFEINSADEGESAELKPQNQKNTIQIGGKGFSDLYDFVLNKKKEDSDVNVDKTESTKLKEDKEQEVLSVEKDEKVQKTPGPKRFKIKIEPVSEEKKIHDEKIKNMRNQKTVVNVGTSNNNEENAIKVDNIKYDSIFEEAWKKVICEFDSSKNTIKGKGKALSYRNYGYTRRKINNKDYDGIQVWEWRKVWEFDGIEDHEVTKYMPLITLTKQHLFDYYSGEYQNLDYNIIENQYKDLYEEVSHISNLPSERDKKLDHLRKMSEIRVERNNAKIYEKHLKLFLKLMGLERKKTES